MADRPILFTGEMVRAILDGRKTMTRRVCVGQRELSNIHDFQLDRCPHGQSGDTLWVREATRAGAWYDGTKRAMYAADADWVPDLYTPCLWFGKRNYKPPMFMPRCWSRITLEITGVRVERVQEISEADAVAEGMTMIGPAAMSNRTSFARLWDTINAKRGYGWDANPWVWVVEFQRMEAVKP